MCVALPHVFEVRREPLSARVYLVLPVKKQVGRLFVEELVIIVSRGLLIRAKQM